MANSNGKRKSGSDQEPTKHGHKNWLGKTYRNQPLKGGDLYLAHYVEHKYRAESLRFFTSDLRDMAVFAMKYSAYLLSTLPTGEDQFPELTPGEREELRELWRTLSRVFSEKRPETSAPTELDEQQPEDDTYERIVTDAFERVSDTAA